jgi:L-amino acid N-acyltransferase YncA
MGTIGPASRFLRRVARSLRAHGVRGVAKRVAWPWIIHVRLHERHIWYELDLRAAHPPCHLPGGFESRRADESDLPNVADLPDAAPVSRMRRLRDKGHDLWLVERDGAIAFVCWIFRGRAPVTAAKGGWIELPDTIVSLEDSLTVAAFRGRGIAPGAWSAIAEALRAEGVHALITKIEDHNRASRAAVAKAGFREVAEMTLDRDWGRSHVTVSPSTGTGRLLASLIVGQR